MEEEMVTYPEMIACYVCGFEAAPRHDGVTEEGEAYVYVMEDEVQASTPMRRVLGLGPVVEPQRDPTETYRLECGHTVI